jgi:hypothetical protein
MACNRPIRWRRTGLWGLIALEVFSLICVGLRMYSRWKVGTSYKLDDYVMIVVLVSHTAQSPHPFFRGRLSNITTCSLHILPLLFLAHMVSVPCYHRCMLFLDPC